VQLTDATPGDGGRVTLPGLTLRQLSPEGGERLSVTVPVKPFNAVTVIVETAGEPGLTIEGEEAEMEKSGERGEVEP